MKLEVGMYVRTIGGRFYQIAEKDLLFEITKQTCKKASFNIIDLIEVGDYVNGVEVMEVDLEEKPYLKFVHGISTTDVGLITYMADSKLYGIKSIVTKEQFKANEYVIEK